MALALEFLKNHYKEALLLLSEVLGSFAIFKSNSICQLLLNLLKKAAGKSE